MKRIALLFIGCFVMLSFTMKAIAEEAVTEIPPSTEKPLVGYNRGFFLQNESGSFVFKMTGRLQPRFEYNKQRGQDSNMTFLIRRARIDFGATIADKASFYITLQHSTNSSNFSGVNITNVTASYEFSPEFAVNAGMVGMPLSIIGSRSSLGYFLIEPPIVMTQIDGINNDGAAGQGAITPIRGSFGNPSGLGVEVTGQIKKFGYDLSIVNGADPATGEESDYSLNPNKRVSAGARVWYDILDSAGGGNEMDLPYSEKAKWTVSLGGNYQGKRVDTQANNQNIKYILTGSLGTSFKWRGFAVNAEAFGRKTKLSVPYVVTYYSPMMDDFGYYIDMGYFVIPNKLEIAGEFAQIIREGPNNNSLQFGGGINWYIVGNNLKLQLSYMRATYFNDFTDSTIKNANKVGLMLTTSF